MKNDKIRAICESDAVSHRRTLSGCHVENHSSPRQHQKVSVQMEDCMLYVVYVQLLFVNIV